MFNLNRWMKRTTIAISSAVFALCLFTNSVQAEYPEKPIKVFIGFSAGGSNDTFIRTVGKFAPRYLGQKFKLVYKIGGGGSVAVNEMLHGNEPDGYTLAVGSLPHQLIPTQIEDIGYRIEDVNWLAIFAMIPNGIYVKKDSPYQSLSDVIAAAKDRPGKLKASLPGPRTGNSLFFRQFLDLADVDIAEVQYGGGSDMYRALLGAETELMVTNANWAVRQPDELRLLALAASERFPLTPEVPTFIEQGLDLIDASVRAIIAPAEMPADIAATLLDGLQRLAADPEFIEEMSKLGLVVDFRNDLETNDYVSSYIEQNQQAFEALRNSAD